MGLADPISVDSPTTKQTTNCNGITKPYKTKSAEYKAVTKANRALPSMSEKKIVVVKAMLRSFDAKDMQEIIADVTNKPKSLKGSKGLKPDVIAMVKAFYERDNISRISPNMRDCKKFKDPITERNETDSVPNVQVT